MNWKSWPYWVKGGVLFMIVAFLFNSSLYYLPHGPVSPLIDIMSSGLSVIGVFLVAPVVPLAFRADGLAEHDPKLLGIIIVSFIILGIYWFLLGSGISFLCKKLKTRNTQSVNGNSS